MYPVYIYICCFFNRFGLNFVILRCSFWSFHLTDVTQKYYQGTKLSWLPMLYMFALWKALRIKEWPWQNMLCGFGRGHYSNACQGRIHNLFWLIAYLPCSLWFKPKLSDFEQRFASLQSVTDHLQLKVLSMQNTSS